MEHIEHDHSQPLFPVSVENDLFISQPVTDARRWLFADPPTVPDIHDVRAITQVVGDDLRALHAIVTSLEVQESSQTALRVAGRRLGRLASALAALSEYVHQTREAGLPALDTALTALNPDLDILRLSGLDAPPSAKIHTPSTTSRSVVVGSLADATTDVDTVAYLFEAAHWRVTNLGAMMPATLAVSTVAEIDPAAFVLVIGGNTATPDDTATVIANMQAACPDIRIGLYGATSTITALNVATDWSADNTEALVAQIIADTPDDFVFVDNPSSHESPAESPLIQDDVPTVIDVPMVEVGTRP